MPATVITQTQRIDDVVDWLVHKGFNIRKVTVTNGATAIALGDNLIGHLIYSTNGTTWKRLESADNLAAAGARLGILLPDKKAIATVAGAASMGVVQALTRGPSRVNKAGIVIPAGVTAATVYALLESASDIQVVEETGVLYAPTAMSY